MCANWLKFYDPESGIAFYMVSVGSVPDINVTDIANLTQYNRKTHEACVQLTTGHYLEHGKTYYTTVWGYNGAIKQRNCVGISNGGKIYKYMLDFYLNFTNVISLDNYAPVVGHEGH